MREARTGAPGYTYAGFGRKVKAAGCAGDIVPFLGRDLVPALAAEADRNDAEAFGHLSADERERLRQTLQGVVARLGLEGAPAD